MTISGALSSGSARDYPLVRGPSHYIPQPAFRQGGTVWRSQAVAECRELDVSIHGLAARDRATQDGMGSTGGLPASVRRQHATHWQSSCQCHPFFADRGRSVAKIRRRRDGPPRRSLAREARAAHRDRPLQLSRSASTMDGVLRYKRFL